MKKVKLNKSDLDSLKKKLENEPDHSLLKNVLGGASGPVCEKGVAYADSIFYNAYTRLSV